MTTATKSSQSARILRELKDRRFMTNIELNKICFRYGARIHELRKDGWNIQREYLKPGVFRYWLAGRTESEFTDSY